VHNRFLFGFVFNNFIAESDWRSAHAVTVRSPPGYGKREVQKERAKMSDDPVIIIHPFLGL
jgi:hypothetical protein